AALSPVHAAPKVFVATAALPLPHAPLTPILSPKGGEGARCGEWKCRIRPSLVARISPRSIWATSFDPPGLPKPLPRQLSPSARRCELACRNVPAHRRHAAVGGGNDVVPGHVTQRFADQRGDFLRRLDRFGGDIDHAELHVLAREQPQ